MLVPLAETLLKTIVALILRGHDRSASAAHIYLTFPVTTTVLYFKHNPGLSGVGQVCLQTYQDVILGIAWQCPSSDVATHVAVRATCNSQVTDIRYVALQGEQRNPYSTN